MKIKQIGEYNGNAIETILKNRNIENLELFLNPDHSTDLDPFDLHNMQLAAEVLISHLMVGSKIGLVVDPDADGMSSSTVMYQYLKLVDPTCDIQYFLHDGKSHGLTEKIMTQIADTDIEVLLVPDAGSNDNEAISRLYHMGIEVIIIDHHEIETYPEFGILVNNQSELNVGTNRNLVGVGMVYKFCQAMDSFLEEKHADKFLDLVAIGQVGDASDTSQNEVRNLIFKGINNFQNPFVKQVLSEFAEDLSTLAPRDLSFSIIPLINSVVRVGTMEEKDFMFRALNSIGGDQIFHVEKRKKNKETGKFDKIPTDQTLYEYAHDICKKVKARQASIVKKTMLTLEKDLDDRGGVMVAEVPVPDQGSITGLVANKISSKFQKPVLLVHKIKEEIGVNPETKEVSVRHKYVGSGRGTDKVMKSLKDWCNDTGLVEFAQGHANAFGISIFEENFDKFKEKAVSVVPQEIVYDVDVHIQERPSLSLIQEIVDHKYLFGGRVHEPLIAFTGIRVKKEFIRQRGSLMTFYDNGVEFIMYSAPEGLFESLTHNFDQFITMDFVGRASKNTFGGRTSYQLVIEDCERNEGEPIQAKVENQVTAENIVF